LFTEKDLQELLEFQATEPVLSVYLNTEPNQGNADAYQLRLRSMLKEFNLPQDIAAVEHFLNSEYNWSGQGVAIFSCFSSGFFRAFSLALPVSNMVFAGERPSVKTLAGMLDIYGGYGVVLVDKQGARLLNFHMGELVEQEGIVGQIVKHTKRGGASSIPGRRGGIAGRTNKMDEQIERNMKDTCDYATHFFESKHIRRILIAGSDENVAQFRSLLPKSWQSLVAGTFAMGMAASQIEVLAHTMQIVLDNEKNRSAQRVQDLIDLAAKGSNAVTGLKDTLSAINNQRVQTLFVCDGYQQPGYHCPECDQLEIQRAACATCNARADAVADLVDLGISAVLRRGGDIEIVQPDSPLEKHGFIGAFLRY